MTSRYYGTYYFWMTTKPTTTATARRTAKINMFILTNNFARDHAILYISLPSLHHYDMKLANSRSPLYGIAKHNNKNCRFLFLNIDNDRYGPKENFFLPVESVLTKNKIRNP